MASGPDSVGRIYNGCMESVRSLFLLDPSIIFLNHGSFGATPRPVFERYQELQIKLEKQPVLFLGRKLDGLLWESRTVLGEYLNARAEDLVYIPNATHGVNILAHSLDLAEGDEVLTTDHEYGACDFTWKYVCNMRGARYIRHPIPLPVSGKEEIVERLWEAVTSRTRALYLSHITSPTAMRLPVEVLCKRAREAGILTIVDAAHSPGQIPVDLQALGADLVFGNCHKWMLSPKGAGFLYSRSEVQSLIEPLIVSWGMEATPANSTGSRFIDLLQWTGTRDPAAFLAVPAAIQFMQEHDWPEVRRGCHELLRYAIGRICEMTGQEPLYPLDSDLYHQMGIAPLPPSNLEEVKRRLYDEYHIEVPLIQWGDRQFVRISIQAYNTAEDVAVLLEGLKAVIG